MQAKSFVAPRRRSPGMPRLNLGLTGLVGLAVLAIPSDGQTGVWATEPILLVQGPEQLSDPALARSARRPGNPISRAPQSARALPDRSPLRVFQSACLECHDSDGRGEVVRDVLPKIPDFTDPRWQDSRSDAELIHSILNGKGKSMRPMKDALGGVDVKQMVALIRSFRGGKLVIPEESENPPAAASSRTIVGSPDPKPSDPLPLTQTALDVEDGHRLFQQFCVRCHGADGTGTVMRANLPSIPNFTDPTWQARQSDAQLVASVLEGSGARMPAFRGRIDTETAHHLITYIRTLSPTRARLTGFSSTDFETRFRQLEQQFRELERRSRELSPP